MKLRGLKLKWSIYTEQKMKFSIKDFFSKCDQIHRILWIWSHFLKKSLMENFIFCAVLDACQEMWRGPILHISFNNETWDSYILSRGNFKYLKFMKHSSLNLMLIKNQF